MKEGQNFRSALPNEDEFYYFVDMSKLRSLADFIIMMSMKLAAAFPPLPWVPDM